MCVSWIGGPPRKEASCAFSCPPTKCEAPHNMPLRGWIIKPGVSMRADLLCRPPHAPNVVGCLTVDVKSRRRNPEFGAMRINLLLKPRRASGEGGPEPTGLTLLLNTIGGIALLCVCILAIGGTPAIGHTWWI